MKKFLSILISASVLAMPLALISTPVSAQTGAPAAPAAAPAEKAAPTVKAKAKATKGKKTVKRKTKAVKKAV